MPTIKDVEIFRVGTWRGSHVVVADAAMLDRIVSNFQALSAQTTGFAVPLRLGHNSRVGEPAYGYAENVRRQGSVIVADLADVPEELVDKIGKRQYNSVSVEIIPQVIYEGKTYSDVLRGVAVLGAEWPAVKGLKPLSASLFSDEGGEWIEKESDMQFTQEQLDALITAAVAKATADLAGKVTAQTERAERAEGALKVFKDEAAKAGALAAIDKAIADGKVLPKQRDELMAMADAFGARATVTFKVGDKEQTGLEMFQGFLDGLPVKVQYGEFGSARAERPGDDRADLALDAKAKELMVKDTKLTYSDAVQRVLKTSPELKQAYFAQRNEG